MGKNNNTNSDNQPKQTPNCRQRQVKKPTANQPDERTSEAGYQKLPPSFRPKAALLAREMGLI